MTCAETTRLHAFIDNEMEQQQRDAMQRHIDSCSECRAELDELLRMRTVLRQSFAAVTAPQPLRDRIQRALHAAELEPRQASPTKKAWKTRSFWLGAVSGVSAAAATTVLAVVLLTMRMTSPVLDEMLAAHVQSLRSGQLIAVASTDRHTVKPWFAGRADVSPAVADFATQGYRLLGGRVDNIAGQRAAVSVYQHGRHFINVFSWEARQRIAPNDATRNGYHVACWQTGDLDYCAMSDTGWEELRGLENLLRELAEREQLDHGS